MRILVVNADCIETNSSANLCHIAYLNGLVEAGHDVELLCASEEGKKIDEGIKIPNQVDQHTIRSESLYEKLSSYKKDAQTHLQPNAVKKTEKPRTENPGRALIRKVKDQILQLYGVHGIYSPFIRKCGEFHSKDKYDFVISISTPVASHAAAYELLKKGNVTTDHWIQIWEDPWYSDAYGYSDNSTIYNEEKRLLSVAQHVCYVSPLTLDNQRKLFPESADKMYWQPLPCYYNEGKAVPISTGQKQYGYFGNYYPTPRNLEPFYRAAVETAIEVNICGEPSDLFKGTERVHIFPRMSLDDLKQIEDRTNVLVFLCNRRGGQIPGKIYQYSATHKIILFIMDGTDEEQRVLREYFGRFNRYVFCENNKQSIMEAIHQIENENFGNIINEPVDYFNPLRTIKNILDGV